MKYSKILFTFIVVLSLSCSKDKVPGSVQTSGVITVQGITTYMYGTHVLTDTTGCTVYALRSTSLILDDYLNKNVEIKGNKVSGYPVDGGPEYLDVYSIK